MVPAGTSPADPLAEGFEDHRKEAGPGSVDARIPGHYIVVLRDSVAQPADVARAQVKDKGGRLGFTYGLTIKGYSAELSHEAVEELRRDPRVKYVMPDRKLSPLAQTVPKGIARVRATQNATADIDSTDDARVNVDVAIIDTGVDQLHPDLNVFKRTNCVPAGEDPIAGEGIKNCVNESGTDLNGHGTHVAGTVAAIDNGSGVVGVAPGARLWSVRVLGKFGGTASWVVAGVEWVTARSSEIEVANMSLGGEPGVPYPALEEAITASVQAGVVYVAAAGNDHLHASSVSPAKHPDVITVSALADYDGLSGGEGQPLSNGGKEHCEKVDTFNYGEDDTLAWFSNRGSAVEVVAPGACIYSTVPGGGYDFKDGTSMAAPHVAGAAALLASKSNPGNKAQVEAIRQQLIDEGGQDWNDRYLWNGRELTGGTFSPPDGLQEPLLDVGPAGPAAYTTRALDISSRTATLNGGANPGGVSRSYRFEYGTSTSYGAATSYKAIGSGQKDLKLSEAVSGLLPDTTYHYRLATKNDSSGEVSHGADRTFVTPPSVLTGAATGIGAHRARLEGSVNPTGEETSYRFDWGTTSSYGNSAPGTPKAIGAGNEFVQVAETLTGLKTGTTYHYRLVATNAKSETYYGKDKQLTTSTSGFLLGTGAKELQTERADLTIGPIYLYWTTSHWNSATFWGMAPTYCQVALEGDTSGPEETVALDIHVDECEIFRGPFIGWSTVKNAVTATGCQLVLYPGAHPVFNGEELDSFRGSLDLAGANCAGIRYVDPAGWCTVTIPPQRLGAVEYWNTGSGTGAKIEVNPRPLEGLKYVNEDGMFCGSETFYDGEFGAEEFEAFALGDEGQPKSLSVIDTFHRAPASETGSATQVTANQATLNGSVTPNLLPTTYQFEYGTTTSYGSKAPASPKSAGSGVESVSVSEALSGLAPRTTYHYRIVASNSEGTTYGFDRTFTTWGEWSLQSTPNPSPPPNGVSSLADVSCPSATLCLATGTDGNGGGSIAQRWNGSKWSIETYLSEGAANANGITCTSTTSCLVVGSEGAKAAAEHWLLHLGAWLPEELEVPQPAGATSASIGSVSYTSSSACTAVGTYLKEGKNQTLAMRFDGSEWSIQSTPNPGTAGAWLTNVSCPTSTSCFATGAKVGNETFAAHWDGSSWSTVSTPEPQGAESSHLAALSCTSATACTAVGSYWFDRENEEWEVGEKVERALAMRWNGASWSIQSTPEASGAKELARLKDVACATSTSCSAVGAYASKRAASYPFVATEEKTLALSWGGAEWAVQSTPNPEGKAFSELRGISCSGATACTAVGIGRTDTESVTLGVRYG